MNPILQNLNQSLTVTDVLKANNPDKLVDEMMKSNPNFRRFMEQNRGKSPEQIAKEYGINLQDAISRLGNCK